MQSLRQAHSQCHPAQDAHDGARGAPVQVPVLREDVEDGGEPRVPREGAQRGEAVSVSCMLMVVCMLSNKIRKYWQDLCVVL